MATYSIGSSNYQIVIGSLNEPVIVDDKTGIDLSVYKCATAACAPTMNTDGDMDGPAGTPVTGLEQTLKVTLKAGSQTKTMALVPQDTDGKYTAPFYPTVATTISYEFTGTIAGTPVDFTYACLPEGTPKAPMTTTQTKLSDTVTQTSVSGGFGCPLEKADYGFPEPSAPIVSLEGAGTNGNWAIGVAALALALAAFAVMRKRS